MVGFDLLTPWLTFGLSLAALLMVRRWIQRHLFGVGWIIAQEKHLATVIYYLILMPGVFVHEASHWIVAGVLNVKTRRLTVWPEADHNGTLEPAFISVEETHNPIYLTLIGLAPFAVGLALVLLISNSLLSLPVFVASLASNDLNTISAAFGTLLSRPDFPLWFYLLFAISNTMLPSREDRRGWLVIIGLVVGVLIGLVAIGLQNAVIKWLSGPLMQALSLLSTVFVTVLVVDCIVAVILFVVEAVMERVTHRQAPYRTEIALAAASAQAAPAAPILTSIYQYRLPLPAPDRREVRPAFDNAPAVRPMFAPPAAPAAPALGAPAARPALAAESKAPEPSRLPVPSAPRPAFTPAASTNNANSADRSAPPVTPKPTFNEPARPFGAPAASSQPAAPPATPARPALPVSTPSAPINPMFAPRPAIPATTSAAPAVRSNLPAPTPPRSPFGTTGTTPRPPTASPTSADYIDAEVIEEAPTSEPDFMRSLGKSKPTDSANRDSTKTGNADTDADDDSDNDEGGVHYADLDESP